MTIWVERKEKILRHAQYIAWRRSGSPAPLRQEWSPPGLELDRFLSLAKHPSQRRVHLDDLVDPSKYGAPFFRTALARWLIRFNHPDISTRETELLRPQRWPWLFEVLTQSRRTERLR
jgi:hypothetical protein